MSEEMQFDVVIVGGGPSGLSAAIRLAQLAQDAGRECSIALLEKGSEIGAHLLSGAVLEPRALSALFPDWRERGAPLETQATHDRFTFLTKTRAYTLPTPPQMCNEGNYIISIGALCRWLASQAEALGVQIFPGFAAVAAVTDEIGRVVGVRTGDLGVAADGSHTSGYQEGVVLRASYVLVGEGARGSLAEELIARYRLRDGHCPQTYAIGLKEVWEVDPARHQRGHVFHSVGWPLDHATYGGSFLYHWGENLVSLGFVIGLDYRNPHLDTYETLQTFKTHPSIRGLLEGGRRISYGARALNEGGWQSIPTLAFPGGALIGCSAGFVNVAKIKGIHTAMHSGMLAAAHVFNGLSEGAQAPLLDGYDREMRDSWAGEELRAVRNIRPAFRYGLIPGLAYSALDTYLLRGRAPWTLAHTPDHTSLREASACKPYAYAPHDGVLTFRKLDSVFLTGTNHVENQPCHLQLRDATLPISHNWAHYRSPETRYCPAGVYEVEGEGEARRLRINAQNCIHCKTCDIKDPLQNIHWMPPEGGGGPNYGSM